MKMKNFLKYVNMSDGDKIDVIKLEQDCFGRYTMTFRVIREGEGE